jgi:hypothetical protein
MSTFTFMLRALAHAVQRLADGGGPFWDNLSQREREKAGSDSTSKVGVPTQVTVPKPH